jgi:hypothetical protein
VSSARRSNPELDELIDQITVDCCNDAEELTAFEVANRHELIATLTHRSSVDIPREG